MGLPAYAPEFQAPAERLHYFHPFRIAVAILVIFGAYLGLIIWIGGNAAGAQARLALPVALLVLVVGRTFQPRTLSADATEIRWKKMFQPPQRVPRHDVVAIQYLTTARPGAPRYYFVNRDGNALLWVDRFTPARMGSFASYLGIPLRPVSAAPSKNGSADAAMKASAIAGSRRAGIVLMAGCAVAGLAFTLGSVFLGIHDRAELAAYERAPLCERASADPLTCRFDTPAVVTGFSARGHIDIRLPTDVPTVNRSRTWIRLANGAAPDRAFAVGDTVQIEVFDGYLMAINGAHTDDFAILESNASWLTVALAGLFLLLPLIAMVLCWKGPDSWFVSRAPTAPASKSLLDDPPAVPDLPGPKEKAGAIERFVVRDPGDGTDDGWPTLIDVPDFDYRRYAESVMAAGIPSAGERLLAEASIHYVGVLGTSSILLLTDRRLVVLGRTRLEIPRARISLLAYWGALRDAIAVNYQTMSGPRGVLLSGPQRVMVGGPKTDMHRLFMTMQTAFAHPDQIREPVVIVRRSGAWGRLMTRRRRLTHQLWLAWVG
ncbi:MAG TPA: hypothetical protein VHK65_12490 [Candidatus Dormibacteraeota bacterium]|nr:hypothetical protein [Candidatus Dormibacteraeota bacterium]